MSYKQARRDLFSQINPLCYTPHLSATFSESQPLNMLWLWSIPLLFAPEFTLSTSLRAIDAQNKPGYTPVGHEYFEALITKVRGLGQYWVVGYILRLTLGKERKKRTPPPEWVEGLTISDLAQMAEGSQGCSPRELEVSLNDAFERRLIARERIGRLYRYKAVPQKCRLTIISDDGVPEEIDFPGWFEAPKYKPQPAAPLTTVPRPKAKEKATEPMLIKPGQTSDTIVLDQAIQQVIYRNAGNDPVGLFAPRREGETLVIEIGQYPHCSVGIHGKEAPPNSHTAVWQSKNQVVDSKEDAIFESVRRFLSPKFLELYRVVPDDHLVLQVVRGLGDATVDDYVALCAAKLQKRSNPGSGLWIEWAKDAATAALALSQMRQQHAQAATQASEVNQKELDRQLKEVAYWAYQDEWAAATLGTLSADELTALQDQAISALAGVRKNLSGERFYEEVESRMMVLLKRRAPSFDEWQQMAE